MAREDWQDHEEARRRAAALGHDRDRPARDDGRDPRNRAAYRADEGRGPRADDYGQADYSSDYGYDSDGRRGYRRYSADDAESARRFNEDDDRAAEPPRSWMDRAGHFFSPGDRAPQGEVRARRRRGPSDRVLWAVISERLDDARGLDLHGVEVVVEDAEVTLNGLVRHKADKRRIENIADVDGVRHVQNNLRVREHGHWTFF